MNDRVVNDLENAKAKIKDYYESYRKSESKWKWTNWSIFFLLTCCSVTSIITVPPHSTFLSASAIILTILLFFLRADRKAFIYGEARIEVNNLLIESEKSGANADDLLNKLQEILKEHIKE